VNGMVVLVKKLSRILTVVKTLNSVSFDIGGHLHWLRDCSGARAVLRFCTWAKRLEVCVRLSV
jgi:hypothetical protein